MINCSLGTEAPPYIIVAISVTLILALVAIIKNYKDYSVNIYETKFGIFKLSSYIKFFGGSIFLLMILNFINMLFSFDQQVHEAIGLTIKLSLCVSSLSYLFGLVEYYFSYKESLDYPAIKE